MVEGVVRNGVDRLGDGGEGGGQVKVVKVEKDGMSEK